MSRSYTASWNLKNSDKSYFYFRRKPSFIKQLYTFFNFYPSKVLSALSPLAHFHHWHQASPLTNKNSSQTPSAHKMIILYLVSQLPYCFNTSFPKKLLPKSKTLFSFFQIYNKPIYHILWSSLNMLLLSCHTWTLWLSISAIFGKLFSHC